MNTQPFGERPRPSQRQSRAASGSDGRSQNDGGLSSARASADSRSAATAPSQIGAIDAMDARADELMSRDSSDGRPPGHRRRMVEWWWFGAGALLIAAVLVGWSIVSSTPWRTFGAGLAIAALLVVSMVPVLAAGILRGREHRQARGTAQTEDDLRRRGGIRSNRSRNRTAARDDRSQE